MIVLKESNIPQVGIFFYIDGQVVSQTIEYADFRKVVPTVGLHKDFWGKIASFYPSIKASNYLLVPRGRVAFNVSTDRFNIEIGPNLNTPEIINKVMYEFGLSKANTDVIVDSHYDNADDIKQHQRLYGKAVNEVKNLKGNNDMIILKESKDKELKDKELKIKIREVKKSDLDDIVQLLDNLSDEDKKFLALDQKFSLIKQLIKNEKHCFVATIEGKLVAFMRESGRPEGFVLLEELVVDPDYRNKGIASKMLDYMHEMYPKTLAKTNAKNEGMISLLKKHGYKADNPKSERIINWTREEEPDDNA